jgi:succinoglycan biosynthesis transport protein ExoP
MTGCQRREAAPEWTIADLLAVLYRRRIWIIATSGCCIALAVFYWACTPPRYRATAQIEVQSQSQGAFGLANATADRPSSEVSDSFDANLNLQTDMGILQSDALALDVIRRTGLEHTPDYFAPHAGRAGWLRNPLSRPRAVELLSTPLADAPSRRYIALRTFSHLRRVATVAGTRLISISYSDRDPVRATRVANALVQSLSDYTFQSRSSAAAQSASWLATQLTDLKKQTDALDERAASLDRETGALGDDDSHNVVLAR